MAREVTSEIIETLQGKYSFLSVMLKSIEGAIGGVREAKKAEDIYETLASFLGEFPTRKMVQDLAKKKGINEKVQTKEDAIKVLKMLIECSNTHED